MPIPHVVLAVIDQRKLTEYLLSDRHSVGRHKARVFRALGYRADDPERLAADLMTVARSGNLVAAWNTGFGSRYIADGAVHTPSGRTMRLRTIWVVPRGTPSPRFVTAYPLRRRGT